MINKGYRLQLAKLLKLYKEVATEEATLIAEADEIEVGTEVFVEGEEGMTPAPDGEYTDTVNNRIIVVTGGTITEIREKEQETNTEEGNQEGNQEGAQEENMENNEGSDNGSDNGNSQDGTDTTAKMEDEAQIDALKAEIEAKDARIAELEAELAELKAKIDEVEPSAEEAEKFQNQKPSEKRMEKIQKAIDAVKLLKK